MRIVGVNIPEKKHLRIALTAVYGIGQSRAKSILEELSINPTNTVGDLNADQETAVRKKIEEFTVEGDLRRSSAQDIKRLKDIKTLRGYLHGVGLPVRGQRTKTNARTRKGPRKTMGSGRVKLQKK
ncbi:MAG: 30S ribosomal protein S13 [Candidatus Kaiserbacteria bacterium]|nr:30S ribosomal protein S13 [Candidatus Kaiserbacteria bacterium]